MGFLSGLFKSGPSGKDVAKATPFGQLPKFQQQAFEEAVGQGVNIGRDRPEFFQPQGFEPGARSALEQLTAGVGRPEGGGFDFGQRGSDLLEGAGATFRRGAQTINQGRPDLSSAFSALSGASPDLSRALQSLGAGESAITGGQLQQGISEFINPFTQQVIDPATQDIEEAAARQRSQLAGQVAGNLGAFGGQSVGIENALTNQFAQREIGRLGGQLRSQAFNTASQQALSRLTGERERSLAAGGERGRFELGRAGQELSRGQALGGLELDRARTAIGGGSALANLASQRGALGRGLLDAQTQQQNLQDQLRRGEVEGLQSQVSAGDILRQFRQQQLESPLRQAQFFRDFATTQPGVGAGAIPSRESLASQIANLGKAAAAGAAAV